MLTFVIVGILGTTAWWLLVGSGTYRRARAADVARHADELRRSFDIAFAGVHDYREARPADWAGLDRAFYAEAVAVLEREGFTVIADIVDETMRRAFPNVQTVMRVLLGDGGRVRVAVYQMRMRGWWRLAQLLGFVPRALRLVECVSELASGRFVSTASSRGVDAMAQPDAVELERLPVATPPGEVLARHRERLQAKDRDVFVVMTDLTDMLHSVQRGNVLVARFRAGVGPLTEDELTALRERPLTAAERELLAAIRRDAAPAPAASTPDEPDPAKSP